MGSVCTLPNGLVFAVREGTSDTNSAISCAYEDAYGLSNYTLTGRLVFDIGSHVGGVAMLAASLGATVVAVEPVPENAALIRESIALNGFEQKVTVVEAAAGEPGGLEIAYGWSGDGAYGVETATVHAFVGNSDYEASGYTPEKVITVPTVTMQDLVNRHGLPHLVKLDCEGGEWPLLAEPITAHIPVLVGEYHHWNGRPDGSPPQFEDNPAEVERRIGATHVVRFHGPDGIDAGHFLGVKRA